MLVGCSKIKKSQLETIHESKSLSMYILKPYIPCHVKGEWKKYMSLVILIHMLLKVNNRIATLKSFQQLLIQIL